MGLEAQRQRLGEPDLAACTVYATVVRACRLGHRGVNLWRDIIDSLNDGIIVLSPALEPIAVNPAAESLIGASHADNALIGELMEHNRWLERMLRGCLDSGKDLSQAEATLAVGENAVAVRAEVSPLLTQQGRLEGAIVLLHDLSHQKGVQRTIDSQAAEASLGLSPAGLAHEIKNPLTGIKGAAELLAGLFPSDGRAQQYCGLILDGVERLAGLVEQVLAVSGPHRLKQERVNIHKVLHQALAMAALYPVPPEGIAIEQEFDPSLPEVVGDEAALERVFLNLIKNAVEAIEARGVIRLRTRMETEFHTAAGGRRRQFLRVEVSDSGQGMNDVEFARLFTPFHTTKPSGTGLGLVLSQRIVVLHGGRIWAERGGLESDRRPAGNLAETQQTQARERQKKVAQSAAQSSKEARGTTFKVILPVATAASDRTQAQADSDLSGKRI